MALPVTNQHLAPKSPLHNKLAEIDRPMHSWYRFVLSFPPHLVRDYFTRFGLSSNDLILDPFCGTGTTLVEAKKFGFASIGVEANPMAALASRVKTDWSVDPFALISCAEAICQKLEARWIEDGIHSDAIREGRVAELISLFGLLSLEPEQMDLLLAGSISPLPLHRCLALRNEIEAAPLKLRGHLRLALAWTSVNVAGNIRFGPEVGITAPKVDAPVAEKWLQKVAEMATDLASHRDNAEVSSRVIAADSRNLLSEIAPGSISCVFTSPPYPNEKDYTRTTRLESVILEMLSGKSQLRELKQSLLRSNTRNVYVNDLDHLHVENNSEVQRIAEEIEARRLELGKTSGFERLYHRVTRLYFGGMAKHFSEMRTYLKPGAMLGYVVGDQASYLRVMIRTSELLRGIAEELGYEHVSSDVFRTRIATITKSQLVEDVLVLRWPG